MNKNSPQSVAQREFSSHNAPLGQSASNASSFALVVDAVAARANAQNLDVEGARHLQVNVGKNGNLDRVSANEERGGADQQRIGDLDTIQDFAVDYDDGTRHVLLQIDFHKAVDVGRELIVCRTRDSG
jgi:hypothetical protein